MKTYSWGFFFENGEKANFIAPFGPLNEEKPGSAAMIDSLEGPWMDRLYEYLPGLRDGLAEVEDWCWCFILVNPPTESTEEEVKYFKEKGYTDEG